MAAGLLGTTAGAEEGQGFTACPPGTDKLVKFEGEGYAAEDKSVTAVKLTEPTNVGGEWTSTVPIAAVVVKGGSGEDSLDIIEYDPHATSGSYTNAELVNKGDQNPDISFVEFCTADEEATTTTTTTTQSSPTTSTEAATTTATGGAATTATTAAPVVGGETETATSTTAPAVVAGETQELPRTGTAANVLALLGAGMILGGVSIMGATRRWLGHSLGS